MSSATPLHLSAWLDYSTTLSPTLIDLNLDRPRPVFARLLGDRPVAPQVITVGGTNGKGSTVALLTAWLRALGVAVGSYTSPHLFHFTERLQINGLAVDEAAWCAAFSAVDGVRDDVPLTAFEFQTLAALWHLQQQSVAVAVLEIGLGGRLDAVNLVDSDAAIVTNVALDHSEWLGSTREQIAREKGAIFRPNRSAICGDSDPPASLLAAAAASRLYRAGVEFSATPAADRWQWRHGDQQWTLPRPTQLHGDHQLQNAASALMALTALQYPLTQSALDAGLAAAQLPGRFQVRQREGVEWIFDVAHNPAGASAVALAVQQRPCRGATWGVMALLADKNAADFAVQLAPAVDHLWLTTVDGPRGRSAAALRQALSGLALPLRGASDTPVATVAALSEAIQVGDRVVVTGSFAIVAQLWALLESPCG